MSKKRREDREGNETYEVWIHLVDDTWKQTVEAGNDGIFQSKQRALAMAGARSRDEDVMETLVIERRPIASFNGPAIGMKGRTRAVEKKKKEETDAASLHGNRPEAHEVVPAGPGHGGETGVRERGGEGDPAR